jgi:uncharacterized membrane protein
MRLIAFAVLIATVNGCVNETELTQPAGPLAQLRANLQYRIDILPASASGPEQGGAINNQSWVAGWSLQPNGTLQATLWKDGSAIPLGTLFDGLHSAVQWPGLNSNGMIVGISRTSTTDPLGEAWTCSTFIPGAGKTCLGFAWENGVMTPLPTLGGTNGFAAGVNGHGQVVGWAETPVHDPTCTPGTTQVLQFRAVLWEPRRGLMQELKPYPGDSTSAATAINERGQAVGISGDCDRGEGRRSAKRAVMWDNSAVIALPDLGGDFWHIPMAINDRGDVVGLGNPPDGNVEGDSTRAFLWTRAGGIRDLGKVDGDASSLALGINASGQIVGASCGAGCRAILWQDGELHQLKDLVPEFPHHLWSARHINDQGQITGRLIEAGTNRRLAYIATPIVTPSASAVSGR